jgi:hypothetical protein
MDRKLVPLPNDSDYRPPQHFCHADGCLKVVPQDTFFCAGHFDLLPREMRQEVSGVQKGGVRWSDIPTDVWCSTVANAMKWLRKHLLAMP